MTTRLALGLFLCAVACAAPLDPGSAGSGLVTFQEAEEGDHSGIQYWVPELFEDLWEVFDVNLGAGYGFGFHVKATELFRLGIFDMSDFGLLGVEASIFDGEYAFPPVCDLGDTWDIRAAFGVGVGGEVTFRLWEFVDFVSTLVTLNYWSFDAD